MISVSEENLKIIRDILKQCVPHCEVRAFGSRYAWTNKDYSDLDIAIVGDGRLEDKLIYEMKDCFESSDLSFRVDVLDWHGISEEFQKVIDQGYEVIWEGGCDNGFGVWNEFRLGDVCIKIGSGVTPRGGVKVYQTDGVALIRSQNIYDLTFENDGLVFINDVQAKKMKNVEVLQEDILLNITGDSVARCCQVPNKILPARVNQHVSIVRPKQEMLIPTFLKYYMINHPTKELLLSLAFTGGTRMALTKAMIENLVISAPLLPEQKAIASILSALDDKIDLNNCINKTLEEMAQALFKAWFVDFEPFKDGEFEDSELGMIPKGWRVGILGDLVTTIDNRGKTPLISSEKTKYPIIDVKALSGPSRIIDYNFCSKYVDYSTYKNWFRNGHPQQMDVLISTVGTIGQMKMFYGDIGCMAQNVVAFRSKSISPYYIYQLLKYLKNDLVSYDIGSVQPSIKVTHIIRHKLLIPNENSLDSFHEISENISGMAHDIFKENDVLTTIRDALLPKLMSGEIRVPAQEVSQHV